MPDFVHLHVASSYSLRYGTATPQALAERAKDAGMPALALTDRDGLYGAYKHAEACQNAGIKPILGADLALEPAGRITLLAEGRRGWASLCRLVSAAHAHGGRGTPAVTPGLVAAHAAGLIVLLGNDSDVGHAIAARRPDMAARNLRAWRDRCEAVVEITDHAMPGDIHRAARMLKLAIAHRVTAVLTNAVRYADPADSPVAEVLDAARNLAPLGSPILDKLNGRAHLASPAEMAAIAERIAEASGAAGAAGASGATRASGATGGSTALLVATLDLAARCVLDPLHDLGIGAKHLPETDTAKPQATLRFRCEAALTTKRFSARAGGMRTRLERELNVIEQTGMASYFLTVADVAARIRAKGIRCAIRGSGAGSLVNHLIGISAIDPLEHDLIMERFLSPGRQTLPDIDLDVESARRIEAYRIILDAYGEERCACVCMMETYRARSAIRDVAAAMGLPPSEIDAIAKAFPHIRAKHITSALTELPELRGSRLSIPQLATVFRLAEKLDGLPRHVAMHPCGVLLSSATLADRTAVERSLEGLPLSHLDKDDAEIAGVIKLDVLGVRMQSAMAYTLNEISRTRGETVDLDAVDKADEATYAMIRDARTLGCFQIESPGQRELVTKLGPRDIGDLIVDISLFRPGPVNSDMITPYLLTRHGRAEPTLPHPDLRGALAETGGVVVFHEQVMRIIDTMTGCGLSEADQVRRALADPAGLASAELWFRAAAGANGYDPGVTGRVWDVLAAFGGFGFCKAHAAAFAIPTYQSAWLKRHYPAAFYAGVLTHDPGMYPKRVIVADAKLSDVPVLPVDVNASADGWRVEKAFSRTAGCFTEGIRVSLRDVKGISDAEVAGIVAGQPYRSLRDFHARAGVSRPVAERLVLVGAFDSLWGESAPAPSPQPTRRDLLARVAVLERAPSRRKSLPAAPAALDLFADDGADIVADAGAESADGLADLVPAGQLRDLDPAERIAAELDVLGFDVSQHVLTFYAGLLDGLGVVRSPDLPGRRSGETVLVAGVKVATQTPAVRSGQRIIFATLDDAEGLVDLAFFESVQDRCAARVFGSWLLLVRGRVRRSGVRQMAVTVNGAECWDLQALEEVRRAEGMDAVRAAMAAGDLPPRRADQGGRGTEPEAEGGFVFPNGFTLSPYAETGGPGGPVKAPPRNLWHASPGSAGNTYPSVPV